MVTSIWCIAKHLQTQTLQVLQQMKMVQMQEEAIKDVSGAWSPSPAAEGNYMIRARVSYEVVGPVITSPVTRFSHK